MNGMYPSNPLTMGNATFSPYYTPMQNPIVPNYPVIQQQTVSPQRKVECVNGKESAFTFPMGPNSSVILVDNLSPRIFFVTTDSSGYKAVKAFKIIPEEDESQPIEADGEISKDIDYQELMNRIDKLEERLSYYEQSNSEPANTSKSSNGNAHTNDRNGQSSKGSNGSNQSNGSK